MEYYLLRCYAFEKVKSDSTARLPAASLLLNVEVEINFVRKNKSSEGSSHPELVELVDLSANALANYNLDTVGSSKAKVKPVASDAPSCAEKKESENKDEAIGNVSSIGMFSNQFKTHQQLVVTYFECDRVIEDYLFFLVKYLPLDGSSKKEIKSNFEDFIEQIASVSNSVKQVFEKIHEAGNHSVVKKMLSDKLFSRIAAFHLDDDPSPTVFKLYQKNDTLEGKRIFIDSFGEALFAKISEVAVANIDKPSF